MKLNQDGLKNRKEWENAGYKKYSKKQPNIPAGSILEPETSLKHFRQTSSNSF